MNQSGFCEIGNFRRGYLGKSGELVIDSANRLLNRFLKRPTDAHDLTDALHAAAEEATDTVELLEIPTRNLHNNIVQTWFEACSRDLGDGVPDFVQGDVETQLGGDKGKRVSGCFRGKSRRS